MATEYQNPFASKMFSKADLIGRESFIRVIEQDVIRNGRSISLYGMPNIGKRRLIYKAILSQKDLLHKEKIFPIEINLVSASEPGQKPESFFHSLVEQCKEELVEHGYLDRPIEIAADAALRKGVSWASGVSSMQRFFRKIYNAGIRIIFIIYRFDYADTLFNRGVWAFERLFDLASHPEYSVAFIILSRRPLREIVPHVVSTSLVERVIISRCLPLFDEADMEEYFKLLASVVADGVHFPVTSELKRKIDDYCGRHPYLLEKLGYELVETFLHTGEKVDVGATVLNMGDVFINYVKDLKEELSAYGLLNKLFQVVVGPYMNITFDDEQNLLRYGLIKPNYEKIPNEDGVVPDYLAFCDHLQTYLSLVDPDDDVESLWSKTEQTLRCAIANLLEKAYGPHWFEELEKRYPDISKRRIETAEGVKTTTIYDRCRTKAKEILDFHMTKPSQNPLDHTRTPELFDIIFYKQRDYPYTSLWTTIFLATFKKDFHYWKHRADFLSKFRNPVCHSLANHLYEDDLASMREYCREILRVLEKYIPK